MQKIRLAERRRRILAELRAHPTVRISSLAGQFNVTTETVRRDVDALSRAGMIRRTYGGAAVHSLAQEPALHERHRLYPEERTAIARTMLGLIADGDVLMIDSGATTAHLVRQLVSAERPVTVITNSLLHAQVLGRSEAIKVIVCPGYYDPAEAGTFGAEVSEFLQRYSSNHAIFGVGGLSEEGLHDFHAEICWVKRTMIERAEQVTVLADHSKFGVRGMEIICPYRAIDRLVVDRPLPAPLDDIVQRDSVEIIFSAGQ